MTERDRDGRQPPCRKSRLRYASRIHIVLHCAVLAIVTYDAAAVCVYGAAVAFTAVLGADYTPRSSGPESP